MIRVVVALALALAVGAPVLAQEAPRAPGVLWQGANYDPAIPAPESVIGHALGERLTLAGDVHAYFRALQKAAPDRMVVGEYARTWEGRPLLWAAISSPRNIARLDAIRAASVSLGDARRTDPAAAAALMADQPLIVWLAYSVHGNEAGPAEASMGVARHLLAARGDPRVAAMLDRTVVIMVPTQNPDGRDRFISGHEQARGLEVDTDALSAERAERWPNGRTNHYLFDLNRDWFAQTQPETQGHSRLMRSWRPQVVTDAHEMGTDESFFFPPEAEPINPLLPAAQMRSKQLFGRANAATFDREGLDYFTREVYDAFYPGYGDAWPAYLGAIGMTYEQGSSRGLAARRSSGETITLFDTVRSQFLASLTTIDTAAANRDRLLQEFYDFSASAVREGRAKGAWILPRTAADPGAADRLAELLARQGVEVGRSDTGFSACGRSYEPGTYVVDMAQPAGRLVQVLLDPSVAMKPEFVARQERRRAKGLPTEMYDTTAWALPALFNTPSVQCAKVAPGGRNLLPADEPVRGAVSGVSDPVGYIVPAGSQAMRFLARALRQGLKVRSAEEPFTLDGRTYPGGSLVLTRAGNPPDVAARVAALADASGASVIGVGDTWVTAGPSIGSEKTPVFVAPRIAMAWDEPTAPTGAGAVRYLIERQYGYPVTVIRTARLKTAQLDRYDVLILPDGGDFKDRLGTSGVANLRDWVKRGGVLIGIGGAVEVMADPDSQMLDARRETLAPADDKAKDKAKDDKKATVPGERIDSEAGYASSIRPDEAAPDYVPGAVASAVVDPDHWLGAGAAPTVNVLVEGNAIYTPLKLDQGVNVVRFSGPDRLTVAGTLWDENRRQLAFKPVVMVQSQGRGQLIAFTQDPAARGFLRGMDVLFLNAIFRGAAHASPVR
jgi:zinc carboxypeptidase